jgi:GNAT superfamily N-acetyltransferase
MVEIIELDTSKRKDVDRFIWTQIRLYEGCKYYVPPLWDDAREQLNRKRHPYYQHSDAGFFVAVKAGKDVGRIAALENRRYNEYRKERAAFFYLFDSIDDVEVSRALFGAAEAWAKARGLNHMYGPKGFIPLDAFGVLVEGFEYLPALEVPYNYSYYDRLVTDAGYTKYTDVLSAWFDDKMELDPRVMDLAERVKQRRGIVVRPLKSKAEIKTVLPTVVNVYNDMFVNNWEYVPVTQAEADFIAKRLMNVIRPELIKLAYKGDELIGFLFAFPDVNEAIQKIKGRLWPFGFITLLRALKTTKRIDLNGFGVVPKYQGGGANAVMYAEIFRTVRENGFTFADLVQMEEKNDKIQAEMQALGVKFYKRHRIYQKSLG